MPFHINNITQEIIFSTHDITEDTLSGVAEEFPYSGVVDVFDGTKLIDIGKINTVYEKYEGKKIIYKRHFENSKLEKEKKTIVNTEKTKTKSKDRTRTTLVPNYRLVNAGEPVLYVNKKFLT